MEGWQTQIQVRWQSGCLVIACAVQIRRPRALLPGNASMNGHKMSLLFYFELCTGSQMREIKAEVLPIHVVAWLPPTMSTCDQRPTRFPSAYINLPPHPLYRQALGSSEVTDVLISRCMA